MIEKLIEDRFLFFHNLQKPKEKGLTGAFSRHPVTLMNIEESEGIANPEDASPGRLTRSFGKTRMSALSAGHGAKVHRNFQWLSWWIGLVSEVRLDATEILTGPMSGCWVMVYKRGQDIFVGHVGTEGGSREAEERSRAVKECWNAFARENPDDLICGFQPHRYWRDNGEANKPPIRTVKTPVGQQDKGDWGLGGKGEVIFGVVTPSLDLWTIFLYRQEQIRERYRIAAKQKITPIVSKHVLSNI